MAETGLKDDVPRYPRDAEIFIRIGDVGKFRKGEEKAEREHEKVLAGLNSAQWGQVLKFKNCDFRG